MSVPFRGQDSVGRITDRGNCQERSCGKMPCWLYRLLSSQNLEFQYKQPRRCHPGPIPGPRLWRREISGSRHEAGM